MLFPAKAAVKNYTEISEVKNPLNNVVMVIEKEFTADNLGAVLKSIASVFVTLEIIKVAPNFRKFKVALNSAYIIFLKGYAKNCA